VRILYHHRTQADGAEGVHIASMIDAFRTLGHDVRLLGAEPQRAEPQSTPRTTGSRLKAALPEAAFELLAAGYNVAEYLAVRRALRAHAAQCLYVRHARFGLAAPLAGAHAGVPVVLEVNCLYADARYHQFEPLAFSALARRLEQRALRTATLVAAVSTPLVDRCRALGARHVLLLPNGADTARFDPSRTDGAAVRRRFGLERACVVGWAGILRPWHGLDLLLEAIARVDEVHLLLVGDGPARADVEARARALGLAGRVHITGRVSHDDMPAHLAAMDLAVVADDRTGVASPMKLLEYRAMGKAVVAPDLANIRDVVRPGVDATLFEPGDISALSSAIAALAADAGTRMAQGRAARAHVVHTRTWLANAQAVTALVPSG